MAAETGDIIECLACCMIEEFLLCVDFMYLRSISRIDQRLVYVEQNDAESTRSTVQTSVEIGKSCPEAL